MPKNEIYNSKGTMFGDKKAKSTKNPKNKDQKRVLVFIAILVAIFILLAWPLALPLLVYVIWYYIGTYPYIFIAVFFIFVYLRYRRIDTGKKGTKNSIITFLVICFIAFITYTIWSYVSYQLLLQKPDVVSLTARIKSEYPECKKIANVSYRQRFGDVTYDIYTFQMDQSGGCNQKTLIFSSDGFTKDSGGNIFWEYTSLPNYLD